MHHASSPFPSLTTCKKLPRPASDTSTSPSSSRTTSPPSSPSSSRGHNHHNHNHNDANNLFDLSFPPHSNKNCDRRHHQPTSNPKESRTQSTTPPNSPPQRGISILPGAVLRGRSSMMVLRRRPSAVDMALTEERSRADGNAIERQGLDLMERRPVDMNANREGGGSAAGACNERARFGFGGDAGMGVQQPRFVMGGIFEVMEGRA